MMLQLIYTCTSHQQTEEPMFLMSRRSAVRRDSRSICHQAVLLDETVVGTSFQVYFYKTHDTG